MFARFVLTPTFLGGFNFAQLREFSFATRADWVQWLGNECFHRSGICLRGRFDCGGKETAWRGGTLRGGGRP